MVFTWQPLPFCLNLARPGAAAGPRHDGEEELLEQSMISHSGMMFKMPVFCEEAAQQQLLAPFESCRVPFQMLNICLMLPPQSSRIIIPTLHLLVIVNTALFSLLHHERSSQRWKAVTNLKSLQGKQRTQRMGESNDSQPPFADWEIRCRESNLLLQGPQGQEISSSIPRPQLSPPHKDPSCSREHRLNLQL